MRRPWPGFVGPAAALTGAGRWSYHATCSAARRGAGGPVV